MLNMGNYKDCVILHVYAESWPTIKGQIYRTYRVIGVRDQVG